MKRIVWVVLVAFMVAGASLFGQAGDVTKILADARAALGGEKKLAAIRSLDATGQSTRVVGQNSLPPADAEFAFELPDKFMRKDVVAMMMNAAITRTSGFNGATPFNVIDQPPAMPGQVIMIRQGSAGPGGGPATPEQQEQDRQRQLVGERQELARLALGLLLPSVPSYPLQFAYGGQAESPDGKADVVDVTGEGGFQARLFIDASTHLPLMLSWMAKEPLVIQNTVKGGPGGPPPGGGGNAMAVGGAPPGGHAQGQMTPEDREKAMKELDERRKDAEAKLRTVEYRLFYGDYREVDGVKVPFSLERSIDGKPTEQLTLEKVRINGRIDPKKFEAK
jgi:hypothetical protein